MYVRSTKATWKEKLVVSDETKLIVKKTVLWNKNWIDSKSSQVVIDNSNLIDFISDWDFSKVEEVIKDKILLDQKSYNTDITKSLNTLETNLKSFYKSQEKLLLSLNSLCKLLSYIKWKDYFIKWFSKVDFDLSDSNNNLIIWILEKLNLNLSENDFSSLMVNISNFLEEKPSTSDNWNKIENTISSEKDNSNNIAFEEDSNNDIKWSFDINKHFMDVSTDVSLKEDDKNSLINIKDETNKQNEIIEWKEWLEDNSLISESNVEITDTDNKADVIKSSNIFKEFESIEDFDSENEYNDEDNWEVDSKYTSNSTSTVKEVLAPIKFNVV